MRVRKKFHFLLKYLPDSPRTHSLAFRVNLVHFSCLEKDRTREQAHIPRVTSHQDYSSKSDLDGNEVEKHCPCSEWEADMSKPSL